MKKVSTILELQQALKNAEESVIELQNSMTSPTVLHVPKGVKLVGAKDQLVLLAFSSDDGIALNGNNEITNIAIQTNPSNRAIFIESVEEDLGIITLQNLTITGQIQLLTREATMKTTIIAKDIDVVMADSRRYSEQPQKYGVNVYQGAFTIYNYNSNPDSLIKATLENITIGRENAPSVGSGIFISGFNDNGGQVRVDQLTTGDIYTNGMIPAGQPNLITGGIFIVNSVKAEKIHSLGTVVTYGTNDMVLDVWGEVVNWTLEKPVISYGASGIGFVNFGIVHNFIAKEEISTYGLGARGFNQYDGTVDNAEFDSITTYGQGAIGIQISKPVGSIKVNNSVETHGSIGNTLVKGVIMSLAADGISVKPGGEVQQLEIGKNIVTHGDNVTCYHIDGGVVENFHLGGELIAKGQNSAKEQI
ncbi:MULTISPECIES: hypothetical protein [Enterococcus]|uniref:hypothetical protein n=1 Tax=Enterococcus TaxID=1350 RepID=UPI00032F3979|nr:hypothetical protein [Enterococcus faecalis]APE73004.1 hypothetical protein BSG25_09180 [Enterococcus faecalis]EOJ99516.1 hypothetical protein WOQ_01734 [Enterococcus faecalis EnGen0340]MBW9291544.1 hypothetical protein [Enterococcus faecalis]MDT2144562.1 hypothetical protein [Enterococcus faecalis]MDV7870698.1 hypothetical protein [Enterococcus faecalis]